jgi:hypothetical protein
MLKQLLDLQHEADKLMVKHNENVGGPAADIIRFCFGINAEITEDDAIALLPPLLALLKEYLEGYDDSYYNYREMEF